MGEVTKTETVIDYGIDPIEMSCEPGRDDNNEMRDVWNCNPSFVNNTEPSESPCIFAFKIVPDQMKWSLMHSRRLEISITLQEKK